ncbi:MAG TPA: 23S rRNA (uridine(2552)-2'-O)-methyltransferase RlmE [Gammaproteobacteria bacterium]|jgi:23S rRNA (uridine2552-2'-O)-methyltransferase|nr:23S rRNA (uridine(2552)-2'-O)-methyltransferase RlmE [Gammaproteobacteria bacterium]
MSSSPRWLKEHFSDPYVKQAQQAGYRSRAVFKLQEIQDRDRLFKPGMTVVDLGAAPGGWSQLLAKWGLPKGRVIAIDLLPIEPIAGVEILQGDFTEQAVLETLLTQTAAGTAETKGTVDWVVSDMLPNLSGNASVDIPRAMYLAELAIEFALRVLKPQGGLLMKVFQGEGQDTLFTELKRHFRTVVIRKPKASRGRSREIYVLATELR